MPVYKVNVKWGKEKMSDIECNTDEPPMLFKSTLFSLTGVVPERMKVMVKGAAVQDDDWSNIKLMKNNMTLMMMGSATELPKAPEEKSVFLEDMTESQFNEANQYPAGIFNMGNTCYMAATLQCFKTVPELTDRLTKSESKFARLGTMAGSESVVAAMKQLFNEMDTTNESVPPLVMVKVLHMTIPRFAERGEQGGFQQQDANECWTELMRMLSESLPGEGSNPNESIRNSFIQQYFGGEMETRLKCSETEDEMETVSVEKWTQLRCHISTDVRYMQLGLTLGLKENIEKNSQVLGRNAVYVKTNLIKRLPSYLTINFIRFFYKEKEQINAKILKDIKFPMEYDAYELCSPELQTKLAPARDKFESVRVKKTEMMMTATDVKAAEKAKADSGKVLQYEPHCMEDDIGASNSGYYELQAVLTHQGRSSNSGHYVAWVKQKADQWLKCDDEKVSIVTDEEILKLSGGGDWHVAYTLLYGPKKLEVFNEADYVKPATLEEVKPAPMQ